MLSLPAATGCLSLWHLSRECQDTAGLCLTHDQPVLRLPKILLLPKKRLPKSLPEACPVQPRPTMKA